jgi:hypothetical protein
MIKSYKIKGNTYHTIIIPKGTVLFRGINIENNKNIHYIFNDLIGYQSDKYFSISPIMNVFFYPVPYMSDSVNIYNTHVMYITQYDIEILLMIKPSEITRANKHDSSKYKDVITTCSNISEKDKCGFMMSNIDPCFTDMILNNYPHIDGYITIAEQDASMFKRKYKNIIEKYKNTEKASHILPGIVVNSREIQSIPEIVLHPLRFRYNNCFVIRNRFDGAESYVKYCINNRAQYNFFPLLYFTSNNIYTFNDLGNMENIKNIIQSERVYNSSMIDKNEIRLLGENNISLPRIYENIRNVFNKMLSSGYVINGIQYNIGVFSELGLYRVFIKTKEKNDVRNNLTNKYTRARRRINHNFKDDGFMGYINTTISFPSKPSFDKLHMTHSEYIEEYLDTLYKNGYSIKKKYKLNRGDPDTLIFNYYVDKVIDRPDLKKYSNMRKQQYNKTYKNIINRQKDLMRIYNGFNNNMMNEIESVDSINSFE